MKRIAIPVLAGLLLFGGGAAMAAPRPSPTPTPTPPPVASVELVKKSETIGSGSSAVAAEAYCPQGKTAIGGGGYINQAGAFWALVGSYPVTDAALRPIGWHAEANRYGDESTVLASITAYAICATAN